MINIYSELGTASAGVVFFYEGIVSAIPDEIYLEGGVEIFYFLSNLHSFIEYRTNPQAVNVFMNVRI